MPDFTFTSPEGKKYTVTGPEGATEAQAFSILQKQQGIGQQPAQPEKPLSAEAQARESGAPKSTFMDIIKSLPGAAVSGLTSFGSLSEQGRRGLIGIEDEAPAQTGPQAKSAIEKNITGTLPKAETVPGKIVEAGVETATNPLSYLGAGGGAARAATSAFGGGAGGEIAGQITGDNPLARIAGGALGGLAGGTKGVPKQPEISAPERGAIRDAAEAAYDTIKESPRKIPMEETSIVAEGIRNKLNEEGHFRESPTDVAVFKTVDRLTQAMDAGHITPAEIHSITKTLKKIESSNMTPTGPNSTARAAGIARKEVFSFLEKFPELEEAIKVGNANYRAFKTSEKIGLAKEKGEFGARATMTGDNLDPALRTQMRQMYFNNKVHKTPEEKEILRSIVEGDTTSNIAKKFNLLKTPLRHLGRAILHSKDATGILAHGAQMLVKSIANRNTARQVDKLDELVRRSSPAAGPRPVPIEQRSTVGAQRGIQAGRGALEQTQPNLYQD